MIDITKKELLDKYGINLDKGKYTLENIEGVYKVNTLQDDTSGCILVGTKIVEDKLLHSISAFTKLFTLLQKAAKTETLQIDIYDIPQVINIPVEQHIQQPEITQPIIEQPAQQIQPSLWKNNFWLNFLNPIFNLFLTKSSFSSLMSSLKYLLKKS